MYLILLHKRACGDNVLHSLRSNLLAHAQFENIFDSVRDAQLALLVQCAYVASAEPSIFEPFFISLGVQQIFLAQTPTWDQDFTFPDSNPIFNIGINIIRGVVEVRVVFKSVQAAVVRVAHVASWLLIRIGAAAPARCLGQPLALADVHIQHCFQVHQHLRLDWRWSSEDELHIATQLVFDLFEYCVAQDPMSHISIIFQIS